MDRKSGVLMHISSLFGDYQSGSFGDNAKYFIDFLAKCGFSYWQVLPFCIVDEHNSPYKSYSAFSGNPYFVDLDILMNKELLTLDELCAARQTSPYLCEFDRLYSERFELLRKAAMRVTDRKEICKYIEKRKHINKFCQFMALKQANSDLPWQEWTVTKWNDDVLFTWQFIQYEFYTQWQEVRKYANLKGIKIIGDIPIYVSTDSSDVWSNTKMFQLNNKGYPLNVAGVSPDYFCEDGQMWGNPLYDWDEMEKDGYKWWSDRIKHMSDLFDAVRIDHFRGIESYWSIPADADTAKSGKWIKGPGIKLVKVIKKAAGNKIQIIAEDLGDITPEVFDLVNKSGFPGMRVFQFGFISNDNSSHLPHNYCENCVAYTGTHDNNTLLGYLWDLDDETRYRMLDYCGHTGDWKDGLKSIIRCMFASNAGLVIMPIQDLLGYGCDTRVNTPGKADGNWAYRITKEQLDSIDSDYFKHLNTVYWRL